MTALQMVGSCEDQTSSLHVEEGLLLAVRFGSLGLRGWHRLRMAHGASTMIADPMKMNMPPRTTEWCNWPPKNSTENTATKSG